MIGSSSVDLKRMLLLKGLFKMRKEDVFSHSVNNSTVYYTTRNATIQVVNSQSQVLEFLKNSTKGSSLQVLLFFEYCTNLAVFPLEHWGNHNQLLIARPR
jgi:hypothetical protein